MRVIILRGVCGAGKTHFAMTKYPGADVCSATDFFMNNGRYRWDPSKTAPAHEACMRKFLEALQRRSKLVIVDNTNILAQEFTPYALLAKSLGYSVDVIRFDVPSVIAHSRNIHGVPLDKINKMAQTIEPCPWWLKEKVFREPCGDF